jgi:hypothetical protein
MMQSERSPHAVLHELAAHPRGDDLARLVHVLAFGAADERRGPLAGGLDEAASRLGLDRAEAETSFGNVFVVLGRIDGEGAGSAGRLLLGTLLARGVLLAPPADADGEARVAEALLWVTAHTPVDPLSALDAALGDKADGLWRAIASRVRQAADPSASLGPSLGRSELLVGVAALRMSPSAAARTEASALASETADPLVRAILGERATEGGPSTMLRGEVVAGPRRLVTLALLGVTGVLALLHLGRLAARWGLHYRRPAELRITARGATLLTTTELIGRTLRTEETFLPVESLLRASREVRYPRAASYAGLLALALGSYLGISFGIDGARAGSPELLGFGALLVVVGVSLDFVITHVASKSQGRCRVLLVPRRGRTIALAGVDPALADAALGRLHR